MIKPTIGRAVWFRPFDQDYDFDKRHAAIIAQVNADGTLNLAVFNDYGVSQAEQNIVLVQGDDKSSYGQAEWMPYQKSQAGIKPMPETALSVDQFSDEAIELALERVLESRANKQNAINTDEPPRNNEGDDMIIDDDPAFVPVSEYTKEPIDLDGEIGSVKGSCESESQEEETVEQVNAPAIDSEEAPEALTTLEAMKVHAADTELSEVKFLDDNGEICEGDYDKCVSALYTFVDGAAFGLTRADSESLGDFQFKLRPSTDDS